MVTSQKDQIQSLIADIEKALGKERPRTPWVKTSETEAQREALARAQAYLMSLQQSFDAPGGWGPVDPSTGQIATPAATAPANEPFDAAASNASADNVLQALLTEMKFLKSSALEPLRLEMDSLREERDSLSQEVKELAQQRNQALLEKNELEKSRLELASQASQASQVVESRPGQIDEAQLNEFLQALMTRLQEKLSVQVSNTLGYLESEHSSAMAKLTAATELEILELKPTGQIEEIRQIQSRSDQLLGNIDATLQQMFETLQTNIDSYQLSLNEGIENMHSLGRQGEVIVRSLVDHLTQQLGQTTPPEPAFYPGPQLDPRNTLTDAAVTEEDSDLAAEPATEPTIAPVIDPVINPAAEPVTETENGSDTVSSLDEILPNEAVSAERSAAESSTDIPVTPELQQSWPTGSNAAAIASLQSSMGQPSSESDTIGTEETDAQAFIKEDGTIDLDLLKLDIDRSEDDPTLTRDDLMIDAAVADEQVAATLSIDTSDIDSKVTPTADSAFLADLTFDDLVSDSEVTVPDLDVSNIFDESAQTSAPDTSESETSVPETPATDTSANESETANSEIADSEIASSEIASEADTTAEANTSAQAIAAPDASIEDPNETTNEATEKPESAFVPDAPDSDSSDLESSGTDSPSGLTSDQPSDQPIEEAAIPDEAVDAILSDDLLAVIEAANEDAERIALQSIDTDLDDLASDLEETVVFEGDVPATTALEDSEQSLESSAIPDRPEDDDDTQTDVVDLNDELTQAAADPEQAQRTQDIGVTQMPPGRTFEDPTLNDQSIDEALQTIEAQTKAHAASDRELSDVSNAAVAGQPGSNLPPVDFDDDLDFFQNDSAPAPSEGSESEGLLTPAEEIENPTPAAATLLQTTSGQKTLLQETSEQETPGQETLDTQPPDDSDGENDPTGGEPADWFLGIDLGATGLSAVVINQRGDQVYPLCWNIAGDSEPNRFRLPAVASVTTQGQRDNQQRSDQQNGQDSHTASLGQIGPIALQQDAPVLRNLKLMVKAGISEDTANVPWMQWSDHMPMPLTSLQSAITTLLQTLHPDHMSCQAVGLKQGALRHILSNLAGVVVGYPTNWPDTYSFNIRESILAAGLVSSPDQVFFVEEAIAALLSALPAPKTANNIDADQQPGLYNCNWSGGTVIINAGAILTETAVANLPSELEQLTYGHFSMRGYTYAGDGIDQDIICQLLHQPLKAKNTPVDSTGEDRWAQLGLDDLTLPQPGEADRVTRHRLRQRLNDSALGREALNAARELKVALQEEDEVEVELGNHTWIVTRKDLESKVFMPYVQRINRQVNALLSKQNLATQGVKQVVCTGGSASLSVIARWLRQKFPNATIIQDTYIGEYSNSCSRVAYGLANLCHYPKVLDANRHQYNDYFLLLELLRILPEQPLPAGGILHLLEQRGINTQTCQAHVLALIEGHLPPGLVPTSGDRPLISAQSSDIATYKALSELPLFRKQGGQIYIADPKQGERLRTHLEKLLSTKAQSLNAPMSPAALTSVSLPA